MDTRTDINYRDTGTMYALDDELVLVCNKDIINCDLYGHINIRIK